MTKFALRPLVAALVLTAPVMSAFATDGYFSHGYGMKAKGMGGAAVASTDNAFAGANNPATSAWAGNRMEAGLDWFSPKRSASRVNANNPMFDGDIKSESNNFYIPEFGYNKQLDAEHSYGVTVYGNGGMNTDYPVADPAFGTGRMGIDLTQLIIAPTFALKLNSMHSIGISPLFVYQTIEIQGIQNFQGGSASPTKLSNNDHDHSTGLGVRLGYLGNLSSQLRVGFSYSPKTKMSKFEEYSGMFAGGGGFDIPENYVAGFSYKPAEKYTFAMDYQRINYGDVPSIANLGSSPGRFGSSNGAGFGWKSINVIKVGAEWQYTPKVALRIGYNYSDNPIDSSQVTFNRLAPGVMTKHYTLGGTYALTSDSELSIAYMRALENSVTGPGTAGGLDQNGQPFAVGGVETIRMKQQSLGIQYAWKF